MPGISITPDSGEQFETGAAEYNSVARLDDGTFVVAYRDGNDYNKGKVNVGTRSGTSIIINEANAVIFNNADTARIEIRCLKDSSTFVIVFTDVSDGSKPKIIAGTVSGAVITLGSTVTVNSTGISSSESSIAILDSSYFVVSIPYGGYSYVGSVSGTTITLGSPQTYGNPLSWCKSVGLNENTYAVLNLTYSPYPYSYSLVAVRVGTVDKENKTISFGPTTDLYSTWSVSVYYCRIDAFDELHIVVTMGVSPNQYNPTHNYVILKACSINPNTLVISAGNQITSVTPGSYNYYSICTMDSYHFVLSYYYLDETKGEVVSGTLTGANTLSWDAQGPVTFDNDVNSYITICRMTDNYFLIGYKEE